MKVCHLISGDLWAGAEVMAHHLVKGLRNFPDLELSAVFLNEGQPASEARKLGIPVQVFSEGRLPFLRLFREIKVFLNRLQPDIIHAHRYKENILAWLATRSHRSIRLIATQHGLPEIYGRNWNLKYRFFSRLNFLILSKYFCRQRV